VGNPSPRIPPFRAPIRGVPPLIIIQYTLITLHKCSFRPYSEWVATKKCEIKYEKMLPFAGCQPRPIPLNAASNGRELSEKCLIFALGENEHRQLIARIDGIDRAFLFGNARHPALLVPGSPLCLAIGGHTGKPGSSPFIYLLY